MRSIGIVAGLFATLVCVLLSFTRPAFAQTDGDNQFLLLYFNEDDLYVESPTRARKSVTQTAENMTVVTAKDIQAMNAHTLAEVLNAVTGVQMFMTGGPGSIAQASIQGSESRHVSVFIDGVPLNNLSDTVADLGAVSVQNIEKIEIIKGPASSSWGSALGGVINIITKSGRGDELAGMVSASSGRSTTRDTRAEVSGKGERLSYYLTAGGLRTDGFRRHNEFDGNNAFGKLAFDITNSTQVLFSTGYDSFDRGVVEIPDYDLYQNNASRSTRSTLSLKSALRKDATFTVGLWHLHQNYDVYNYQASTGTQLSRDPYEDTGYGASAKLVWKTQDHNLVLGTDLDSRKLESDTLAGKEHYQRKYALYLNDTITVNRFSVTPGIRHDETATNGDFNSPSLGLTYKPLDQLLLRAYASRGFNVPPLSATFGGGPFTVPNSDLRMERVKSYQAGLETTALPFAWLKMDVYRHDISDMIVPKTLPGPQFMSMNTGKVRKQGLEVETRTRPVHNTFLSAGAAFMYTRDAETGRTVPNMPQRTYDVGLHYDDSSWKALVMGHYIYWNSSVSAEGKYTSMIFDVHGAKTIYSRSNMNLELFADLHNIFNGAQYPIVIYKNPGRWSEAGVRFLF